MTTDLILRNDLRTCPWPFATDMQRHLRTSRLALQEALFLVEMAEYAKKPATCSICQQDGTVADMCDHDDDWARCNSCADAGFTRRAEWVDATWSRIARHIDGGR